MDKVTMESWLKVYHNDSLLIKTLGMFDLKEHAALMLVCQRFQYIIRDVIWKKKYNDLFVQCGYGKYIIGWNKPAEKSPAIFITRNIDEGELYEFVEYFSRHLNSFTVKKFDLQSDVNLCEGVVLNFQGNFENLQILKFFRTILKDENIKIISENCKHLKELHLKETGRNTTGKYLDRLNNLETLCVEDPSVIWSYEGLINISKLPLKYLKLLIEFEKDQNIILGDIGRLAETLEVLKIKCYPSDDENGFNILRDSSVPFERLQDLEFLSAFNVENYHFDLVAEKCLNLQRFSITFNFFEGEILKFPPNLKELHVNECHLLSAENAWYILTELNLSALTLSKIDSRKMYKFNYGIDCCRSLKTLSLDPYLNSKFHKEFWMEVLENCTSESFQQVERLMCFGSVITDSYMELLTRKFPMIQHFRIEQTTYVPDEIISGNYINHLKNLKSIYIDYCPYIDFCHFIKILQSSRQLESLTIEHSKIQKVDSEDNARIPSIESCCLTKLYIDIDIFFICQPFWLNLLRLNLLKIEIFIRRAVFTHKFDWEFLLVAFQDKDIAKNIDLLVIEGTVRNRTLKTCRWFVEMLYEPPINRHLEHVLVNENHMAGSLTKSEFYDRFVLYLDDADSDFTIVFN